MTHVPDPASDSLDFLEELKRAGVVRHDHAALEPLAGGVSSDIYRVVDGDRVFVAKRALENLRVADDWKADLSRNLFEQEYIRWVSEFRPDAVPKILYADSKSAYFCMEYLEGFLNWKTELMAGRVVPDVASRAGKLLGEIHRRSWLNPTLAARFDASENFEQLRLDPYLRTAALRNPELAREIEGELERLRTSRQCLVHGDFSPKNILYHGERLVVLDCEVACFGDAAFDLAFPLSHLLLKALYHSPESFPLESLWKGLVSGYQCGNPEHGPQVESTVVRLLPMLLLARVDGKSPVEYLVSDVGKSARVREFAREGILAPFPDLDALTGAWNARIQNQL